MKIHIDEMHWGGLVAEGEDADGGSVEYHVVDGESSHELTDQVFRSYEAAEDYIALHFPGCERWVPPAPTDEEIAQLMRMINALETSPLLVGANGSGTIVIQRMLLGELHQRTHEPGLVARMKALLERFE